METEWEETGETESGNQCKQSTKWRGKRVAELVIMGGVATVAQTLATRSMRDPMYDEMANRSSVSEQNGLVKGGHINRKNVV